MRAKEISNLKGIQKTLMLPLWGRAVFGRLYPEILDDKEAVRIINSLDYDFSEIEKSFGEYGGLCYIVRSRKIDDAIKHFISKRPNGAIVNIKAGFDTTFSRVDNGAIQWYDIDLKEVVAIRKKIIPESAKNRCIAKSVFEFKEIDFHKDRGILFVGGGVFYFFEEEKVRELFVKLAENFPDGELYFDAQTKTALKISNKMVSRSGNKEAVMHFYINDPKIFASWSPLLHLKSAEPYFKRIKRDKRWKISTKINMVFCDLFKMVSFYHFRFGA
ncbi:MAG: class I SAM-dependent methyltransferase [Campylobacteraceae bacterium]|jgi:O-methyltransferase involved in polyketide biosynthesis|nr:class I SAM-dependent methyltransferase [Campylobacteraceae bacterium]